MNSVLMGNMKSKTSWAAILLAVFGILYDNWSQVATLLPPQYVGKAFTVVGLLMLVLRNVTSQSISAKGNAPIEETSSSKQSGFVSPGALIFLLTAIVLLVSCAQLDNTLKTNPAALHLGVDVAVLKFVENSSAERKQSRIDNIRKFANLVKIATSNDPMVTVTALQGQVDAQISKLGLSPVDQALARDLVQVLATELQARIGNNVLTADQKVQVATVMDWILQALDGYPKV